MRALSKLRYPVTAGLVLAIAILFLMGGRAVFRRAPPAASTAESDQSPAAAPPASIAVDQRAPPRAAGFRDTAREAGLAFRMQFLPREQGEIFKINLYDHGCGLAVGDYDGDGREDIYFLNQLGPCALYHNLGSGKFEEVAARMGVAFGDRICVGSTFADYDNDGDQDLYVTSTRGGNVLLRNETNQSLLDVTDQAGLAHIGHSQTAVFFDYDNDSWLDLYLVQTAEWTTDQFDSQAHYFVGKGDRGLSTVVGAPKEYNRLYRNLGNGTFEDATEAAGLRGRGWSGDVAVFDYDGDGWIDVFVTSMFGRAQLYKNLGNGSFADVTLATLGKTPFGGIGARAFDYNNDGLLDLVVADMHSDMWMGADFEQASRREAVASEHIRFSTPDGPRASETTAASLERLEEVLDFDRDEVVFGNALYKNLGGGRFAEVSETANLETFWPWGIAAGDFDNDGHEDLFLPAGMGYPFYYWPNYLMMNSGREHFLNRAFALGIEPPRGGRDLAETIRGRSPVRSSRCAVTADFDGDGRLEIVTNNFNHEPYYFHNEFPRQNYIAFRLRGVRSNRDAIGALVRIPRQSDVLVRQVNPAGGYLSHSSKIVHFGLGPDAEVPKVEIFWPSGIRQTIERPEINQLHDVVEPNEPAGNTARGELPKT